MDLSSVNLERFSGFAGVYDRYRPRPPGVIVDLLTQLAGSGRPGLVVDLGSGTGLSTEIWADRADTVIGIEPNADMRAQAEARLAGSGGSGKVEYRDGLSWRTGLADGCADIVTVSQALHWMQPEPTFAEVARILHPGGVFAAYDCDWPPTVQWEAEAAYDAFMRCAESVGSARGLDEGLQRWGKSGHLERIQASGRFQWAREIVLHHVEPGDAERLIGVALSQGGVAGLLKRGLDEDEIGLATFRREVKQALGDGEWRWYWSYRVRYGVK